MVDDKPPKIDTGQRDKDRDRDNRDRERDWNYQQTNHSHINNNNHNNHSQTNLINHTSHVSTRNRYNKYKLRGFHLNRVSCFKRKSYKCILFLLRHFYTDCIESMMVVWMNGFV